MTAIETRAEPVTDGAVLQIQWGPIIAGGIAATALALVLHSFAAAIGLSVSSTAPTWRDASIALVLLSGLYLLLAAIVSYGFGAYLAGRMRPRLTIGTPEEIEFRDGTHGLLSLGARHPADRAACVGRRAVVEPRCAPPSVSSASVAGESLIAFDLDRLFRGDRRPEGDINYARAEAARILLTISSHRGLQPEDRSYLVRLVAAAHGAGAPEAERRVDDAVARAKENINRARRSAVILAFMTGAAALLGAAAAWFAACAGGQHRDGHVAPHVLWDWGTVRRATPPSRGAL